MGLWLGFAACGPAQTPPIPGNWVLEFEENFDGTQLDGTKWKVGQHWEGINGSGGNSPANITVSGGTLNLRSEQRPVTLSGINYSYATGEISTFSKFRQTYGYFAARIKYPAVKGLWPAFWLMPDRALYGWTDLYYQTYLKFDLTGVNLSQVDSATLNLKVSAVEGTPNNLLFFGVGSDAWSESTITWNNKPVADPRWLAQKYSQAVAGQTLAVDVKSFVAQELAGDKIVSIAVADTFMKAKRVTFRSREYATPADRPTLVVNGTAYSASEDAYVQWGSQANANFGSSAELIVRDNWDNTATTFNGGMEIDIMESLGIWGADKTQHALHWDGYAASHQTASSGKFGLTATSDGYHEYGLYWEPELVEFYVDGQKTWQWDNARVMSVGAYIILSLQLGGWDGNTAGSQVNNQTLNVDWVRVWSGTASQPPEDEPAPTAPLYWDGTDTTADADGGNGTWISGFGNWDTVATAGTNSNWFGGVDAVFGGVAGTVSVATGIGAGSITFDVPGYTLDLTLNSLDLTSLHGSPAVFTTSSAATKTLTLANTNAVTWSGTLGPLNPVADKLAFVKNGDGTLNFSGALAPNSGLTVGAGTLKFVGAVNGDGNSGASVVLLNSAVLDLNGNSFNTKSLNAAGTATKVTSATAATLTLNAGTSAFDGKLEGAVKIVNGNSTGFMRFGNAANNFTGGINVGGATLEILNAPALGSGTLTLGASGKIRSSGAAGHTIANAFTISGNADNATFGLLPDNAGALTFTGTANASLGNAGVRNFVVNAPTSFSCGFTGVSGCIVKKTGDATLTLKGASTYAGGTVVSNGTLLVSNTSGSGTGSGAVNVYANAVLGGTGVIGGPVVVHADGRLTGGALGSVGNLTLAGGLTTAANAKLAVELGTGDADTVVVSGGALALAPPLTVDVTSLAGYSGGKLAVLDWTSASSGTPQLGDFQLSPTSGAYALSIEGRTLYAQAAEKGVLMFLR